MTSIKTNAVRLLDKAEIAYKLYNYDGSDGLIDGISVAGKIGRPVFQVYKTLVTQGTSRSYYVFVINVADELDLKAAAKSAGEKSIDMIRAADLLQITGYLRGGCSPIGMKKQFRTIFDSSIKSLDTVIVSAGKIGCQIELPKEALMDVVHGFVSAVAIKQT